MNGHTGGKCSIQGTLYTPLGQPVSRLQQPNNQQQNKAHPKAHPEANLIDCDGVQPPQQLRSKHKHIILSMGRPPPPPPPPPSNKNNSCSVPEPNLGYKRGNTLSKTNFTVQLFKGLIMDRCVLLTSTPEWVVSPRRAITWAQPSARQPMIITWCWQFPSLSTNILLIKSKLKHESRAIVVGVAMSPCNLGCKYRCRPHSRWRKCTRQFFFFRETEHVNTMIFALLIHV